MSTTSILRIAAITAVLVPSAAAQFPQFQPLRRTLDILQVDSSYDGVWRKADLNQDGDLNDANEITPYYDDVRGSIQLTNPSCISIGPLGVAYVGDSTEDVIVALRDLDGNGDCFGAGEHTVFFTSVVNASNITMASVQGLTVDALGNVFCAVSNAGTTGDDVILRLFDANGDGDADDAGEATVFCLIPNSQGMVGDSIPTEVIVGPDGALYYADVGATGVVTKGVWRLSDNNFDGDANDPGEVTLFWTPPAPGNAFYWGLAVDQNGFFYITDHGNETVWRGRDANGDGQIAASEENLYYQTSASTFWDVIVRDDGTVILCEDQTPDRLTALTDVNGDGDALDAGEAREISDETLPQVDTRPRGATFLEAPSLSVQPRSVMLGQQTNVLVLASKPGDLIGLAVSDGLAANPIPVPPIGYFELSPGLAALILSGTANSSSAFNVAIPIPNDASLSGVTFAFQAISGDSFRNYLTNGDTVSIQ